MPRYRHNPNAFAAALDEQLSKKGKTRSELARQLNVSSAYISRLGNNTAPSPKLIGEITETLEISPEDALNLYKEAARAKGYKI